MVTLTIAQDPTADHGFEAADPTVTGSWRPALESLGVPFRDEGPGFVYFL